ncbi:hypothetical protein [Aquipuribacter nitratireducens]|uniref:Uncharacterized protein n=1 Tax=Aquipuribacter nitratireducens TaxID=650104 RepID=A0ABW0GSL9_9MICO
MSLHLLAGDGALLALDGDYDILAALEALWQPFTAADGAGSSDVEHVVVRDLAEASAVVNRTLVARLQWPAVHAAVVEIGGGAVAVPAVSGAGKSTLSAALCCAGAGYLSDEALVLDDAPVTDEAYEGPVSALPYPKPVALSRWSARAVGLSEARGVDGEQLLDGDRELLFPAAALGGPCKAVPILNVLLPRRTSGPPRLERVPRIDGLRALIDLSFNHYRDPVRFLLAAAATVRGADVHVLEIGEPMATARLVHESFKP